MGTLFNLPMRWRKGRKTTFSKSELGQLMSLYGEHVSRGEWRDYALDTLPGSAIFSVFRDSRDTPLFTVTKINGATPKQSTQFIVHDGEKTLKQSPSLLEALQTIRDNKP